MNILLLNQVFYPDPVATAQHTRDLAIDLVSKGHRVTVITGRRNYERRGIQYPRTENYQGVIIYRVGSTGFGKRSFFHRILDALTFDLALGWKLLRIPPQDLVVSFTSPPLIGLFGMAFCLLKGGKSVQWLMDVNPDAAIAVGYLDERSTLTRLLLRLFELTLKTSAKIVVLDRWMRDRILAHGALEKQMVVIPPWPVQKLEVDPDPQAGKSFRREHGLEGKFVVLYSGNHSIVHPLDTLLEAAIRLKDSSEIVFLFIGSGLRVQDVTDAIRTHNLKNVLQLPPQPREKLPESLGSANLHVVVMGEKVSGLVHVSKLYGVLATGRPYVFIGPKKSHGVDLLGICPYGFHVETGNYDQLIQVIRQAANLSVDELETYSRKNREFVRTQYSAERSLDIFEKEVIDGLFGNSGQREPALVSNSSMGQSLP